MYSFENPFAFLFLLVIPLYYVLKKVGILKKTSLPVTMQDWNGISFNWNNKYFSTMRFLSASLFYCSFFLLVAALANPISIKQEKVYTSRSSEIIFVIDTSPSMASIDIANGNRLEAAKQAITRIVSENKGAAYGIVSCATESALLVPPTMDIETFSKGLASIQIGELGDKTSLGLGISTAVYHLLSSQAPKKTIVLLTDGESNSGSVHPETAAKLAIDNDIVLYITGIGTSGSVPIEYIDPNTGDEYSGYLDSSFDSTSLRNLAKITDGKYFSIKSLNELSDALQTISTESTSVQTYHIKQTENSLYRSTLIICIILFTIAWIIRRLVLKEVL